MQVLSDLAYELVTYGAAHYFKDSFNMAIWCLLIWGFSSRDIGDSMIVDTVRASSSSV